MAPVRVLPGLLSLFYPEFVSGGKTSLAGDVPVGLTGERLCHPEALHAAGFIRRFPRPATAPKPEPGNVVCQGGVDGFDGFYQ